MDAGLDSHGALSGALENYLKTIYHQTGEDRDVRVRDIAHTLNVKAPSVTSALKRLDVLGLVSYVQRESVRLTPAGARQARRISARHRVLQWFFEEVLTLPVEEAAANACSIEHVLSASAMDRLVSLFEFVRSCPSGREVILDRYHHCPVVNREAPPCEQSCALPATGGRRRRTPQETSVPLAELKPGCRGRVLHVEGQGELRRRLIEMGLLPDQLITVERAGPRGDPLWIRLGAFQLALRKAEARLVHVSRAE
jgi:DtxR family Mn-dependent transcriptional regulator